MSKLTIIRGPGRGRSFELRADAISVGPSPDNDIQIKNRSVSRKHAKITRKGDAYFVMDLNSKNGTFINGQQIGPGDKCELKEGHPITLGDVVVSLGRASSDDESATAESMRIDASGEVSEKDLGRTGPPDVCREASEQAESFLQDRPQTALRNMERIYKASSALMESLHADHNINEILKTILNYILELLKRTDRGVFILLDDETGEISGLIPILKKSGGDTIRVYSRTIVDRVIREGNRL
jgi:pSer/pThr/pTyr-binding forkhead associated (FHA) protein